MRVLVTAASKHGATAEIARAIAEELTAAGVDAVLPPADAHPDGYDGVVLGSAVYAGRWFAPAREFVDRHADTLRQPQVWLFSSGPVGAPPKPDEPPVGRGADDGADRRPRPCRVRRPAGPQAALVGGEGDRGGAARTGRRLPRLGSRTAWARDIAAQFTPPAWRVGQWCWPSSRVASTAACVRRSRPSLASRLDT